MARIVDVKLENFKYSITADKLKIGQMAKIVGPIYIDQIVIKVYDGLLVSLTNQTCTWNSECNLEVEPLQPGTLVTLKQE